MMTLAARYPVLFFVFIAIPACLGFAVWVGQDLSRIFVRCLEGLGKLTAYAAHLFLARETFSSWEIPLGAKQCPHGRWGDSGKMKLSSFPVFAIILAFVVVLLSC